ncbi:hypothetical protein [Actinophytocola sp.]|uniref:hypothetical protein n=1 Tax=Actinophytocola sp. TaxID=1872138 RepID=UPI003899AE68
MTELIAAVDLVDATRAAVIRVGAPVVADRVVACGAPNSGRLVSVAATRRGGATVLVPPRAAQGQQRT